VRKSRVRRSGSLQLQEKALYKLADRGTLLPLLKGHISGKTQFTLFPNVVISMMFRLKSQRVRIPYALPSSGIAPAALVAIAPGPIA
jgi:hypothetical protein